MASANNAVIADLKEIMKSIEMKQKDIQNEIRKAESVIHNLENPNPEKPEVPKSKPYDNDLFEKISVDAQVAIELSSGPLDYGSCINFFTKEVFGEPKPRVLPIVRKYTKDVKGLLEQLWQVKECNNHMRVTVRRQDEDMIERIDQLCDNIEKELDEERKTNSRQTSITQFVSPRRYAPY